MKRALRFAFLILLLNIASSGCDGRYDFSIPVPDNIPVGKRIERTYIWAECVVDVWELDPDFASTIRLSGLDGALKSVGSQVRLKQPDPEGRKQDDQDYWYPAPIQNGIGNEMSFASQTMMKTSGCLTQSPVYSNLYEFSVLDGIVSYVFIP